MRERERKSLELSRKIRFQIASIEKKNLYAQVFVNKAELSLNKYISNCLLNTFSQRCIQQANKQILKYIDIHKQIKNTNRPNQSNKQTKMTQRRRKKVPIFSSTFEVCRCNNRITEWASAKER